MCETTIITVQGMSCGHGVNSVTSEVRKLNGVSDVEVDLSTGTVQITSRGPRASAEMCEVIEEAGYEVTS